MCFDTGQARRIAKTCAPTYRRACRAITRQQTDAQSFERSEGVFLYVCHVVEAIHAGQLSLQKLGQVPARAGRCLPAVSLTGSSAMT